MGRGGSPEAIVALVGRNTASAAVTRYTDGRVWRPAPVSGSRFDRGLRVQLGAGAGGDPDLSAASLQHPVNRRRLQNKAFTKG